MADDAFDPEDRTEPATPRRREEARERGHVARSGDLNSSLVLLAALLALHMFGRACLDGMAHASRALFGGLHQFDLTPASVTPAAGSLLVILARALAPILAAAFVVALAANWAQVGLLFTGTPLTPNPGRLNPLEGFKRMFSARSGLRLATSLLKLCALAGVLAWTLTSSLPSLLAMPGLTVPAIAAGLADLSFLLALRAAIALVAIGVVDFGAQRWQYERDLRMSKHEIKEEVARMEGNPRIRERRRAIQRQIATQRMMAAVPTAAVVVTNPTHFAVALAYDGDMTAPRVVAKGADLVAERIREIALDNGVPIVQKPPLAQALYKGCEVGQEIPGKLYEAVAELLAYVYSLKRAS
ncbi:MAG: flagellar biosynthesis protein FlhB [Candidatus Brocadiae bacterium]|nr:flagellar biosynthesis protein FlhB [Candidatus Brocadiia bacterium]